MIYLLFKSLIGFKDSFVFHLKITLWVRIILWEIDVGSSDTDNNGSKCDGNESLLHCHERWHTQTPLSNSHSAFEKQSQTQITLLNELFSWLNTIYLDLKDVFVFQSIKICLFVIRRKTLTKLFFNRFESSSDNRQMFHTHERVSLLSFFWFLHKENIQLLVWAYRGEERVNDSLWFTICELLGVIQYATITIIVMNLMEIVAFN